MISQPGLKIIRGVDPYRIKHRQEEPDPGQTMARGSAAYRPPPSNPSPVQSRDLIANQYAPDSQIGLD